MARPSDLSVVIFLPAYDYKLHTGTCLSVMALCETLQAKKIACSVRPLEGVAQIHEARNMCFSHFLDGTKFSHMLFVDADMAFEPKTVTDLLKLDVPICGACYPRRQLSDSWPKGSQATSMEQAMTLSMEFVGGWPDQETARGLKLPEMVGGQYAKLERIGTGLMLIRRDAATRMAHHYNDLTVSAPEAMRPFVPSKLYGVFNPMIQDGASFSEDYSFCRRWTAIGGEIWCDLKSEVAHFGQMTFFGSYLGTAKIRRKTSG